MGESGGGSLTGPRLHRLQEFQEDCRRSLEEAQDEGVRLQPGVRRQLLSANDPVHQHKDIYGPFSKKADVYLPHSAEVTSAKYTNMRYNDKSSAKHNLDQFLVDAHKTQIKDLNGTTASVMNTRMRHETHNTDLHPTPTSKLIRDHYIKLVKNLALRDEVDLPPLL